jgi:hypothetical protein
MIAAQAPKVTLSYFQEHFIVRDGVYNESVPLRLPEEQPKLSTVFRRNDTFAVWDERGLTIRVGNHVKSSKLADVAVSPKNFSREEIVETKRRHYSHDVAGLSGAVRVGPLVYFLGRWEDSKGKPWTEALISVDLTEKFPEPRLVHRVRAFSLATKPIDTKLFILDGKVSFIARTGSRWGLVQLDATRRLHLDELGDRLSSFESTDGNRLGLFVEKTAYGTTVAGRVDLHNRFRKILAESRASMHFIDTADPVCVVLSFGDAALIHNTASGAELALPVSSATRRTSRGIVIWSPASGPKKAWLFEPRRWQSRAWWPSGEPVDRP